jgi:hypothetical protein
VAKVNIRGSRITGTFKKPIPWPPPSSPSPEKGQAQSAAPAKAPASPQSPVAKPASNYGAFAVNFPNDIGDPGLLPLLETHGVEIDVTLPSTHWFIFLLTDGLPILLFIGFFVWIGRQASRSQAGMFSFGRSKARLYEMDRPRVTFAKPQTSWIPVRTCELYPTSSYSFSPLGCTRS